MAQMIQLKNILQNKWTYVGAGGVAIAAIGGLLWWQLSAAKVSPLHVFYPERTTFFVEVEPGEALAKKMLRWLDNQNNMRAKALARPGQPVVAQNPDVEQEPFRRALIDKFDTTFEPHVSLGLWPRIVQALPENGDEKQEVERLNKGNAMTVLPLKRAFEFPAIVQRFNGNLSAFDKRSEGKVVYYVEQGENENTFAVIQKKLFMANSPEVMLDLIRHLNPKQTARADKNVFDHPTNKRYLALLNMDRDGTLIVNNTAHAQQLKQLSATMPSAIPAALQNRVLMYADVTPITMGALNIRDNKQIEADFYMPLNLKALHNENLSKEIRGLYEEKKPLSAAGMLPETTTFMLDAQGLDRWYDLYQHHLMPKAQLAQLQQMAMLLTFVKLNWRNDVVGLLAGETVFASIKGNPIPVVLLEGVEAKLSSFNRIMELLVSGKFFPIQHQEVQIGNVAVQSFVVPRQEERVSVGTFEREPKKKVIALAQAGDFEQLVGVKDKKLPVLKDDPAYRELVKAFPKNLGLFLYSDVEANQQVFRNTLRQARFNSTSKSTIALANQLQEESKHTLTNEVSKLAAAVWAEPKGDAEDLVQAKVVLQLK